MAMVVTTVKKERNLKNSIQGYFFIKLIIKFV